MDISINIGRSINKLHFILKKFLDPGRSVGNLVILSLYTALSVVEPLGFYNEYALNEELGCLEILRLWYLQLLHYILIFLLLISIFYQISEQITWAALVIRHSFDAILVILSFAMGLSYYLVEMRGIMGWYVIYTFAFDIRIYLMFKRFSIFSRTSRFLYGNVWLHVVFNLILYLLGAHLIGGLWFTFAINEKLDCLKETLYKPSLDCKIAGHKIINVTDDSCGLSGYGIYNDVFKYNYHKDNSLSKRYFFGSCWGLQNIISLGSNLQSNDVQSQSLFVLFISITGVILMLILLGSGQMFLGQKLSKDKRWTELLNEINKLDSFSRLSNDIKLHIWRLLPSEWDGNKESVIPYVFKSMPLDLQSQIQEALCFERLRVVFNTWSDDSIKALCRCVKPIQYVYRTVIVQEGDMIDEMIIFLYGQSQLTSSSLHGRPNEVALQEDRQIVGRELLVWLANGANIFALPLSKKKVKAVTNVEAVTISAHDLKEIYDAGRAATR